MSDTIPAIAPASPRAASGSVGRRLLDWSKQPTTQGGLSLLLGGAVLALLHPFPASEGIAATMVAAGLPRLLPDNSTDAARAVALSGAIVHAAVTRKGADLAQAAELAAGMLAPAGAAA